jgi:site-specific recombinase XerD
MGSLKGRRWSESIDTAIDGLPSALADGIDAFGVFIELEKGHSPHTVEGYQRDVCQCAQFIATQLKIRSWAEVGGGDISRWLQSLGAADYSAASLARKLSALKHLARFLVAEKTIPDDFTELLSAPKVVRHLP